MADAFQRTVEQAVQAESKLLSELFTELEKVIVGQRYLLERMLIGLLANGHLLIEGVPGLAKTTAVVTLSKIIQAQFHRIQFTPDLLPADLIGTLVFNPKLGNFYVKKGPLFANIILADEINRAPAKVQSALLEAMQERQVTIGEETYKLHDPFLVLATQNPIEQEGTYRLPEAQLDRFMLKLHVTYPDRSQERTILDRMGVTTRPIEVRPFLSPQDIVRLRTIVDHVTVVEVVREYIVDLVMATRKPKEYKLNLDGLIQFGASPRATINLTLAAKAHAFVQGRSYVTPQDVKAIALDVLRHRVILSYEAEAQDLTSDQVVQRLLDGIEVP